MTDELKPVRCGCGGKAVVYVTHWWGKCYVCECDECGTASRPCATEAEAVEAWNRAMGASAEPERKTGEWIEYPDCLQYEGAYADDQIVCSECHHVFNILDNCTEEFDFCPHCGAEMRGE